MLRACQYDDTMVHTIVFFTTCLLYDATCQADVIDGFFFGARYDIAKTHIQKLQPFPETTKAKAKASPTVPPIPPRDADEVTTVPGNNVFYFKSFKYILICGTIYYIIIMLLCLHSMI